MEEVNDVVKNDWTVEVDLLSTTKAPAKTNIGKQIVQVNKWRKKEKGVLLTNTNLLVDQYESSCLLFVERVTFVSMH